jgi:thiol-disulfide isomerase/thioredoxin
MKVILIAAALVVASLAKAQDRSIEFEKDKTLAEVLAKAKSENKLVFIDAYTTWCGPCKWMAKNMFTNNEIADYFNSNFINAKFDMEKGEGIDMAKKYEVFCYPNLLFLDGDGNLVHRTAGAAQEVQQYITMGETAKNPKGNFNSYVTQYESMKNDPSFLADYIDALSSTCLPMDSYVNDFFKLTNKEELVNQLNWNVFFRYADDYNSKEFQYFLQNQALFVSKFTQDSVSMKINYVFVSTGDKMLYTKDYDKKKVAEYKAEIKKMDFKGADKVIFKINLHEFQRNEENKAMFDYLLENGDKFLDQNEVNSVCWAMYEKTDNKKHLLKAASWMKTLTESEEGKNWANMDTYAALMFKLKNKKEAAKIAESAIALAKATGVSAEDYKATEDLLEQIKKLK